jgi:hypothetical protein
MIVNLSLQWDWQQQKNLECPPRGEDVINTRPLGAMSVRGNPQGLVMSLEVKISDELRELPLVRAGEREVTVEVPTNKDGAPR